MKFGCCFWPSMDAHIHLERRFQVVWSRRRSGSSIWPTSRLIYSSLEVFAGRMPVFRSAFESFFEFFPVWEITILFLFRLRCSASPELTKWRIYGIFCVFFLSFLARKPLKHIFIFLCGFLSRFAPPRLATIVYVKFQKISIFFLI